MLVLMTIGIIRRFNDYGVTINRLYLITLNIWCYIVCIGLVFTKARRISWIPISFSILFLLTSALPVNYASITRNIMRSSVEKELKRTNLKLPLTREQYDDWMESLPAETAVQVNDKFRYLRNWFDVLHARKIRHLPAFRSSSVPVVRGIIMAKNVVLCRRPAD